MPELPEVETIKNDLIEKIVNKKIKKVQVGLGRLVIGDLKKFKKDLVGNSFKDIDRIGKLLIFVLAENKKYLLVHLKMTGQLVYCQKKNIIAGGHGLPKITECLPNKYSHIYFIFNDNSYLFFNDMRTFGYMKIVELKELNEIKQKFGLEPLTNEFSLINFKKIVKKHNTTIKAVLLNQNIIAGIGNIYADETLFKAEIKPDRSASSLNDKEIKKLYNSINNIINKAIKFRGTTFNNYVDANGRQGNFVKHLKVYARAGQKCFKCGNIIKKIKIAGRGTHFCEQCQK